LRRYTKDAESVAHLARQVVDAITPLLGEDTPPFALLGHSMAGAYTRSHFSST
jgi:surfactin synthase thioesterase subunit